MKTISDLAGSTIQAGIYLRARFDPGKCGTIDIHTFEMVKFKEQQSDGWVSLDIFRDREWTGGLEQVDYPNREKQPHSRSGPTDYIPLSFDQLDIILNSNGSRFFSAKRLQGYGKTSTYASHEQNHQITVILSDRKELVKYLDTILEKLGVPSGEDTRRIKKDILAKLFPSPSANEI